MFNSKVLRNSSCFVLSSSLISTVQYSAGFATNQNFKYRLINVNGNNFSEDVSLEDKNKAADYIKRIPLIFFNVIKWSLITTLSLVGVLLFLNFVGALFVLNRYGKGKSSCFRKLIEVGKFCWKFFELEQAARAIKDDMVSFFDPQSGAEGHNMKVLRKFLEENRKSHRHLFDPLIKDFSELVNTENLVNDFFKILNIKCILEWLKKWAAMLKSSDGSHDLVVFFEKIEKGAIDAQGVNSKLEELYGKDGKFTLDQFLSVLFGKEEAPSQTSNLELNQGESSLPENNSTPFGNINKREKKEFNLDLSKNPLNANQFGESPNTSGIRKQEDFRKRIQERNQKSEEELRKEDDCQLFFKLKDQFGKTGKFDIGSADE